MPPVRDASTKPSAATVLPAPVACSNQKRFAAFGSSGCSASCSSSAGCRHRRSPRPSRRAAPRLARSSSASSSAATSSSSSSSSSSTSAERARTRRRPRPHRRPAPRRPRLPPLARARPATPRRRSPGAERPARPRPRLPGSGRRPAGRGRRPRSACRWRSGQAPRRGGCERSREGIDLVSREERLVGELRLVLGKQRSSPSSSEKSRRQAGDGTVRPASSSASAWSSARRRACRGQGERWVLTRVRERLARELLSACEIGIAWVGDCDSH